MGGDVNQGIDGVRKRRVHIPAEILKSTTKMIHTSRSGT